jgi:hypothetical protein
MNVADRLPDRPDGTAFNILNPFLNPEPVATALRKLPGVVCVFQRQTKFALFEIRPGDREHRRGSFRLLLRPFEALNINV